jgi:hypothetical protein
MHPDGDVLRPDVLTLSPRQVLEREELPGLEVESDSLSVDNE